MEQRLIVVLFKVCFWHHIMVEGYIHILCICEGFLESH